MSNLLTRFSVAPLHQSTRVLADVASGRTAPDLIIRGGRILSVYTERFLEEKEVWVKSGRIAAVAPLGSCKFSDVRLYDAQSGIIAPGLVDPHIHIESSMMTACAYAEGALLNGTTTIFCDSHEIGNVSDVDGIEWMLQDARQAPLNIFLTLPSTIPATNAQMETCGGDLTADKAGMLFDKWPEIVALGEKMDFVPVCMGDSRSHAIIGEALKRGKPVCGHIYGRDFVSAYAASGVTDTHEAIDRDIANDFLEAGIWVFLRGGPPTTPWHSLPEAIKAVTELGASHKRVCVCTDDRDADDLFEFGLDWVTRQAMVAGLSPAQAWSLGSLHPATRYAMDGDFGALGSGRRADILLLNDDYEVQNTWYGGELVVEEGKVTPELDRQLSENRYVYPKKAYETVTFSDALQIAASPATMKSRVNVLRTELPGIVTVHQKIVFDPETTNWEEFLAAEDLCYLSVIERYGKTGEVGYGLLQNFGLKRGAVGSSVGHDAHNLVLAGTSEADMQLVAKTIKKLNGGVVVVRDDEILASVALPIAGLLSDKRAPEVAADSSRLKKVWSEMGCTLPYMGFNLLPLSVIPEIRLTDKGLVLVPQMEIVPLFEAL
ncbi:adenine deaminase C-terminal domain-containing protein [Pelagicoccus sp. SDUM812002]|uniref:adenine deaminase n=1 Tax=Pelagicoccus sp. SDUM812002 TaxID=3041266 RepID=UPI00280C7FA6|nr:adenine deaminase C-terminal domain-containing protein [Pelagicoccus sp. SDUM812002]MDQ8187776.1 adenine deaminase C-terminal domain-containing protein [Pelagicoccus sp. SDUM812002]